MSPVVKKILIQSAIITAVLFTVTLLLIYPYVVHHVAPPAKNYLLSIISVVTGAFYFMKYGRK
jgi:hypothetical protein